MESQRLQEFARNSSTHLQTEEGGRQLQFTQQAYPFFRKDPYVTTVVFDSHDSTCDNHFDSPVIYRSGDAGYPSDGTDVMRKKEMSCGIGPARFVFYTSDWADYEDRSHQASMQIRIICAKARFLDSDTCESLLDATGNSSEGFPAVLSCRLLAHEARFILKTRLQKNSEYSLTVKLVNPAGRNSASENSYNMQIEYYQLKVIEGTRANVDITYTLPHAKAWDYPKDYTLRGYITNFMWQPDANFIPEVDKDSSYKFAIKTFGVMSSDGGYYIDIVAHPTNVWRLKNECGNPCTTPLAPPNSDIASETSVAGFVCQYRAFAGAPSHLSNGLRCSVTSSPLKNMGSEMLSLTLTLKLRNPKTPVNMYWTATSYRLDNTGLKTEPFTVMLDSPISITGTPKGAIVHWDLAAIKVEQWVTLEFKPGNSLMPDKTYSGFVVIKPPTNFTILTSSSPQDDEAIYNPLPCKAWPVADRLTGQWACMLSDKGMFADTTYRTRVKVVNPDMAGAAQSWRVEIWRAPMSAGDRPVAYTRSLRGLAIAGQMQASIAQANQLLGGTNTIRIDFTASQDAGGVPNTALRVIAPPNFKIIKRCSNYKSVQIPKATCIGSDKNTFRLVFPEPDSIKAGEPYIFEIDVENPSVNVPVRLNFWTFNTERPDGIMKDTARFDGFNLFPNVFTSVFIIPESRKLGPQFVVIRFISPIRIPFDDYIRVRAPSGCNWNQADLGYATDTISTNAYAMLTRAPFFEQPSDLTAQLQTTCEAHFEYGMKARIIVPDRTPIPNRWWIEQFRQTGKPPPNNWRYIAAQGGAGYKTQVLINTKVEPFNYVKEAWQNPTLIVFEGTVTILKTVRSTALGVVEVYPEFYAEAPPMFTYICPVTETVYLPPFTSPLPPDVICKVDHNNDANRNKLRIQFPSGIMADTRYAFTIDLVNGLYVDPITNYFKLQTRLDGNIIEEATPSIAGFQLSDRMDNTQYEPIPLVESRLVDAQVNKVTFIIGTVPEASLSLGIPTQLEVRAPIGFKFNPECTNDVGPMPTVTRATKPFPKVEICQNMQTVDITWDYRARIQLAAGWALGMHAFFVIVQNPTFTPSRNFWSFIILDKMDVPKMAEAWVNGFQIQEVVEPRLHSYNMGRAIAREAAVALVDFSFKLTTAVPPADWQLNVGSGDISVQYCKIILEAPPGFYFPNVCRSFFPNISKAGSMALPSTTTCTGSRGPILTLELPQYHMLLRNVKYEFRFLVLNPSQTFDIVDVPAKWWKVKTTYPNGNAIDINERVPSTAVYERFGYFKVDTLSTNGLNATILRFHFRTTGNLPPRQTVRIVPPLGMRFLGLKGGQCLDTDPMIIASYFVDQGLAPLISGVTRLPEWMLCKVVSETLLTLTNSEPVLGGRPLMAGPVFEFFVANITNAERTPDLNIFQVEANTDTAFGREVWKADGWKVFPELRSTKVESSNPGYGLYTTFHFTLQTITEVPENGYVNITAPTDYYFGPRITTPATAYNPRRSFPPYQGDSPDRPFPNVTMVCPVIKLGAECPFDFKPCRDAAVLQELQGSSATTASKTLTPTETGDLTAFELACTKMRTACQPVFAYPDTIVQCTSRGTSLELKLQPNVILKEYQTFQFSIQGYNARQGYVPPEENYWKLMTIFSDSQRTILDRKNGVPGLDLIGIMRVPSIIASDTNVGSIENRVTITIILGVPCDPMAELRITHPMPYLRNPNAAFAGKSVTTGPRFPKQVEIIQVLNVITMTARQDRFDMDVPYEITIGMSNGPISPNRTANIWKIEAYSYNAPGRVGEAVMLNINHDVEGFKIFGDFSIAQVSAAVLSPTAGTAAQATNTVGAWFMLKTKLAAPDAGAPPKSVELRVYMPPGYKPMVLCGDSPPNMFSRSYNKNREGVKTPFPQETGYYEVPSGTYCYDFYDTDRNLDAIQLDVDGLLDYGLDYAFEFVVYNPTIPMEPRIEDNFWHFETRRSGVILHLQENVTGFRLEQIEEVSVTPMDTTTLLPLNTVTFYMMSDKYIPGGSKIIITAPLGFQFLCARFRTDDGLSNTTTCYVQQTKTNVAEFTIDSQDPKEPNSPFKLFVSVSNPEFTPQNNWWSFEIRSPLGVSFDIRDVVPSFDITGRVLVDIQATFPYVGNSNLLKIVFVQSTILNQADEGNEIVVTAPAGYTFPRNCTGFLFQLSNPPSDTGGGAACPSIQARSCTHRLARHAWGTITKRLL
jgi:hypothetical protein